MSEQSGPLFSVVMPALNTVDTVAAAIGSVLKQSVASFELIVVDDGSTDGTADVVRGIDDSRVRLLQRDHEGAAAARNAGVRAARGRIVSLVDSDDLLMPRYLEVVGKALDLHPRAGFAYTDAYVLDAATGRVRRTTATQRYRPFPLPQSAEELHLALLRVNFIYNAVSVPRAVFDHVGGFDESLRATIDYEMWLRIAAHGFTAVEAPGLLAVYRRGRRDSISSNRERVLSNMMRVYEIAADRHPGSDQTRKLARQQRATVAAELAAVRGGRTPGALRRRGRDLLARARLRALPGAVWYPQPEAPAELAEAFPALVGRGS